MICFPGVSRSILWLVLILGASRIYAAEPAQLDLEIKRPTSRADQTVLLADPPTAGAKSKDDEKEKVKFLRVARDRRGRPTALESAIVSYVRHDGVRKPLRVDLVGAVHVAEQRYFEELNRLFRTYDVVLYELVAPERTRPQRGDGDTGNNLIGFLQGGMSSILELKFQLNEIDYEQENFVHADMSPEEMRTSMADRGESPLQMFFELMGQSMAIQRKDPGRTTDADLILALLSKDRAIRLRRILAEQMDSMGGVELFGGPNGSTIITGRNQKALDVLKDQIDQGKGNIAIFYGAAHLPDMHRRLLDKFQMKKTDQRWLAAWNLKRQRKKNPAKK